jgi:hypothetical protein
MKLVEDYSIELTTASQSSTEHTHGPASESTGDARKRKGELERELLRCLFPRNDHNGGLSLDGEKQLFVSQFEK